MIKQIIREPWVQYAHIKHTGRAFNSTTIVKDGSGQITGTIGEIAFGRWMIDLDIDFEYCADSSFDYDFIAGGYRIDVKTSKSVGKPAEDFNMRIPESQRNQGCDIYVWAYISDRDVYLVGFAGKIDFWEIIGRPVKAGEKTGKFTERVNAQSAQIKDLQDMDRLELLLTKANEAEQNDDESTRTST